MGVSAVSRICVVISLMVIFWNSFTPGTEGKCSLRSIDDTNGPITLANTCIGKGYKRGGGTKPLINAVEWKKGSDYSHGNLDDFCLHTRISDNKDFYESQERTYRGIGSKKFPLLDKLVKKSAWSFQMNGPLKTANMNWTILEENYQLLINQSKANLIELEESGLETELNLRYKIREALEHDYTEDLINDDNPQWDKNREHLDGLPQFFDRNEPDWKKQPIIKRLTEQNAKIDAVFENARANRDNKKSETEEVGTKIVFPKDGGGPCELKLGYFKKKEQTIYQTLNNFVLEYERCKEVNGPRSGYPKDCPSVDYYREHQIVKPSWEEWSNRAGIWSDIYTVDIPNGIPKVLRDSLEDQARQYHLKPYSLVPGYLDGDLQTFSKCLCVKVDGTDIMAKLLDPEGKGSADYNCKAVLGYARDTYLKIRYREVIEWLLEIPKFEAAINFCKAQGVLWNNRFHIFKKLMDTRKNSQYAPDFESKNPYFLEVTGITMRGQPLKNFLHVRIFMNQSVSDDKYRLHTNPKYSPGNAERRNRARGKIKAILLIVKDQDGFPVGSFDKPIPCQRTCRDRNHNTPVHDHSNYKNDLPCSFTPPTAVEHPGLFIWPPGEESTWPKIGVREVHATWHFAQDTCNFVTELHFQALVFENLRDEFLGPDKLVPNPPKIPTPASCLLHELFDRKFLPGNTKEFRIKYNTTNVAGAEVEKHFNNFRNETEDNYKKMKGYSGRGHLWGWTAQYNIIVPTIKSVGGHDWVNIPKLREYNRRYSDINCHAPLDEKFGFVKSVPVERGEDIPNQGMYTLKLMSEFPQNLKQPDLQYYGVHYGPRDKGYYRCRKPQFNIKFNHGPNLTKALDQLKKLPSARQHVEAPNRNKIRCPCPLKPTTSRPEDRTVGPEQIQGRIFHASHMSLAWMVCIPLAVFVARYFKETYSTVFCVQEYWWFGWHVFWMVAAAVYMVGGNLSVVAKRSELIIPDSPEMRTHKLLGWVSINIFAFQLTSGLFRHKDPNKRLCQMILHYVLGVVNFAISSIQIGIISMVPGSAMTCDALITYGCWLLFLIIMYTIMEIHMQISDDILDLDPPRTKCPMRFKRLFGTDAPGRKLRMVMLIIYMLGISVCWYIMRQFIWHSEGLSCKDYLEGKTPTIGKVWGDQVSDATYPNSTVEEQF